MAIPENKRRTIVVRNLTFTWAVCGVEEFDLHIRPDSSSLPPLQIEFGFGAKTEGVFPHVMRPKNPEEGRNYESEHFIFTPKVVEMAITWALDNHWESSSAKLVRARFKNSFHWFGKVDRNWKTIPVPVPR